MDYTQIFADPEVREEFLDRFEEIRGAVEARGGLESVGALEGVLDVDRAADAVKRMNEGSWDGDDGGLEAIIRQFGRPVYLVRDNTVAGRPDTFDDDPESEVVAARVQAARHTLGRVLPSVGRIDLYDHALAWAGTGWLVAEGLVVTNRHVAVKFAERLRDGFGFRTISEREVRAEVDWYHEYRRTRRSRFKVTEVVWIEPDRSVRDVALLRIAPVGEDGEPRPRPIPLATDRDLTVGRWVAVIGYPGHDGRDPHDRERIFDGVYEHKRVAPGCLTGAERGRWVHHDATTLRGNSGSAVVDLATGRAVALHFQGWPGQRNFAVRASDVARLVRQHAS
ncbi:trypsin-like serine peptidase [Streptomyces flavalbus]|uniref:Trypsin-like serine peptidase n=1 Tax=Streptomyces flavalbus TaxID=2665155 RepID=A0ABW2W0R8_9ACTN